MNPVCCFESGALALERVGVQTHLCAQHFLLTHSGLCFAQHMAFLHPVLRHLPLPHVVYRLWVLQVRCSNLSPFLFLTLRIFLAVKLTEYLSERDGGHHRCNISLGVLISGYFHHKNLMTVFSLQIAFRNCLWYFLSLGMEFLLVHFLLSYTKENNSAFNIEKWVLHHYQTGWWIAVSHLLTGQM